MDTGGIFGPKLSGKTTLASRVVREHFERYAMKALILDPHVDEYDKWYAPSIAFITDKEDAFWKVVWSSKSCVVVVEEVSSTIRRDKALIPIFTRLRHCKHKLLVIGHSGMDLLPVMREQIDQLWLFRQPESAAKVWAEVMTERGLLKAVGLRQFEFLSHRLYGSPVKMILPAPLASNGKV